MPTSSTPPASNTYGPSLIGTFATGNRSASWKFFRCASTALVAGLSTGSSFGVPEMNAATCG